MSPELILVGLDLSGGRELYRRCNEVWPHYAEVIRNRKFGVFGLLENR